MAQQTIKHCLELEKQGGACTTPQGYRRHLASNESSYMFHPPSIGVIIIFMTLHGRQNALQTSSHWPIETLCIDSP